MAFDLTFMLALFKNISAIIEKLETRNMSLTSQLEIIKDLESGIKMIPCPTRAILIEKLNNIFEKNPDINIIQMYVKILTCVSVDEHFPISTEMVLLFKYAP